MTKMAVTPMDLQYLKSMLHANLMPLSFLQPELWATEVYTAGIENFNLFCCCDLDLDPYANLTCIA